MRAGPKVWAYWARRFVDDPDRAVDLARILAVCPDALDRCAACGHLLTTSVIHGPRCATRQQDKGKP